jgi:hypothetical protein
MKDIKIKKVSTNKNLEKTAEPVVYVQKDVTKSNVSIFSIFLFGLMSTTALCYVFLISSSIYYAVQASQYQYQSQNILSSSLDLESSLDAFSKNSDRISYINYDSETAITLK